MNRNELLEKIAFANSGDRRKSYARERSLSTKFCEEGSAAESADDLMQVAAGAPGKQSDRMIEDGGDNGEAFAHALRRAR